MNILKTLNLFKLGALALLVVFSATVFAQVDTYRPNYLILMGHNSAGTTDQPSVYGDISVKKTFGEHSNVQTDLFYRTEFDFYASVLGTDEDGNARTSSPVVSRTQEVGVYVETVKPVFHEYNPFKVGLALLHRSNGQDIDSKAWAGNYNNPDSNYTEAEKDAIRKQFGGRNNSDNTFWEDRISRSYGTAHVELYLVKAWKNSRLTLRQTFMPETNQVEQTVIADSYQPIYDDVGLMDYDRYMIRFETTPTSGKGLEYFVRYGDLAMKGIGYTSHDLRYRTEFLTLPIALACHVGPMRYLSTYSKPVTSCGLGLHMGI